ncbi:MAG: hypothetical protein FWD68_14660 [Alphaproteobacteria bacterium]|nr:hypothetical protein [Alphaproteobacteria bacterium]
MHERLGNALVWGAGSEEDQDAAERAFSRGIELQPYNSILYLRRGKLRFRRGRFVDAEADFSNGAKYGHFTLPIVPVVGGLNASLHKLSLYVARTTIGEFYLRRAAARFAQKKWSMVVDDINWVEENQHRAAEWKRRNWPGPEGEPFRLGVWELRTRGRALFEEGNFEQAFQDLREAADLWADPAVKDVLEDLKPLADMPGAREARGGEMLALAALAARRSGKAEAAAQAVRDARAAYAAALSKTPTMRAWTEAMERLAQ